MTRFVVRQNQFIGVQYPAIYRWNGVKWSKLSTPIDRWAGETLVSVTNVPGSSQVYAAGYVDNGSQVPKDLLISRIC